MPSSWNPAGRLWDILYELACTGDLPLPGRSPGHSNGQGDSNVSPIVGSSIAYTSSMPQEHPIPSTSDSRELIDLQGFGSSSHHTAMEQTTPGFGSVGDEFHTQSAPLIQGQNLMGQSTHEIAVAPTRGAPIDSDAVAASLFPDDPLLYGDTMFNFGYARAITSGIGQQAFGVPMDNSGPSDTTVDYQRRPGPETQAQQQFIDYSASHDGGGNSTIPNPDGLTMWTNVPHGFE